MPQLLAQSGVPEVPSAIDRFAQVQPVSAPVLESAAVAPSATVSSNLTALIDSAHDYVLKNGPDLLTRVISALVLVYVGQWLARLTFQYLQGVLRRAGVDETLTKFLARIVQVAILTFTVVAALGHLGVKTESLAAVIAAAGLAVGLALQGSLSNFAAGVMLVLFRPFSVGDFVEAGGTKGIVEEIHIFHTVMRTPDNVRIIVPNGAITAANISNYSSESVRRIDLVVGCAYSDNLLAVKQFLQELVNRDPRVRQDPAPIVAVDQLADNSVNFVVRPWVASQDYWETRWDLTEAIKLGFDAHGFQIPFPQRDVHIHGADAVAGETPALKPVGKSATSPTLAVPTPGMPMPGLVAPRRVA